MDFPTQAHHSYYCYMGKSAVWCGGGCRRRRGAARAAAVGQKNIFALCHVPSLPPALYWKGLSSGTKSAIKKKRR
jgi:hypothetical protein